MNLRQPTCGRPTVERFLADQLGDEEQAQFEDHLGACDSCRQCLDDLAAEGSWWREARGYLSSSGLRAAEASTGPGASSGGEDGDDERGSLCGLKGYLGPTDDPHMLGRLGGYEVVGIVGRGGMGVVLKAFDAPLNRYVAIKVLGPQLATSGAARQRFAREARAAAAVVHDNVMAIHAVSEANGLPYIVMPYVRGPSLEKRLRQAGALGVDETLRIGMQIASGLAAAHEQGLVHRDIKPANILLEEGVERVWITDFGLARAVDDASLTRSGVIAGTPQYMSPEQAAGDRVDHRSDLFSLGSVLYALCTGRPPFRADTTLAVLRRVEEDKPRPIREINPDTPEWLVRVIEKLQAKDPATRFQTAAEVAALLAGYLAHRREPATVAPPELPPPADDCVELTPAGPVAPRRQRWWLPALAAATAVLVAAWLGGFVPQVAVLPRPAGPVQEFYQDFRGAGAVPAAFQPNTTDEATLERDDRGLRIAVPVRKTNHPAGIDLTRRFAGDFEITAGYELLKADRPTVGHGVGFLLRVETATPRPSDFCFFRMTRIDEGDIYWASRTTTRDDGKQDYEPADWTPTTARAGSLRITRTGDQVSFWVTDTPGGSFRKLFQRYVGTEDVTSIRLAAFPGWAHNPVEVRVTDLRVRGLAASESRSTSAAPAVVRGQSRSRPGASGWLVTTEVIGLLVTLSFAGVWAFVRRRSTVAGPATVPAVRRPVTTAAVRLPRRRWLAVAAAVQAVGLVVALIARVPAAAKPADPTPEVYYDFRGGPPVPPGMAMFGQAGAQYVKSEVGGTRVTLPKTFIHPWGGVGVETRQELQGDFEVTATVEVLNADVPPTGIGVGVGIRIEKAAPHAGAAGVFRMMRPDGKPAIFCDQSVEQGGGKPAKVIGSSVKPCADAVGRLRLKRTGTTLSCQWGPGTTGDRFVEYHTCEFGAEDLTLVRFTALTGRQPCDVDVRLIDLRLRSAVASAPVEAKPRPWLSALAGLFGLSLVVTGALWLAADPRRRTALVAEEPAEPAPAPEFVAFACLGCGKQIIVKAEWAGKKGRCVHCRREMVVPQPPAEATTQVVREEEKPLAARQGVAKPQAAWGRAPGVVLLLAVAGLGVGLIALDATTSDAPVSQPDPVARLSGHTGPVHNVRFAPGGRLVSGSGWPDSDKTVRVWDVATGRELTTIKTPASVHSLDVAPDGKFALAGLSNGRVAYLDLDAGTVVRLMKVHDHAIGWVAFAPDGRRALSTSDDGSAVVWQLADGRDLVRFAVRSKQARGGVLLPDGRRLLTADSKGAVQMWDIDTGDALKTIDLGHPWMIDGLSLTPDGRQVLIACVGGVRLYDIETGREVRHFQEGTEEAHHAVASPDGRSLLAGDMTGVVRLWDLRTGELIQTLGRHNDIAFAVAFSPDGRLAASGGGGERRDGKFVAGTDHDIRLWPLAAAGETPALSSSGRRGWLAAAGVVALVFVAAGFVAMGRGISWRPSRRVGLAVLGLAAAAVVATVAAAVGGTTSLADPGREFYRAFRNNPAAGRGFDVIGPDAEKCVRFEPEGLRIALPAGYNGERPSTGITAGFGVKGDFEITVGFELLGQPEPADAGEFGTRFSLGVFQDTPRDNIATVSRSVGAKNGRIFVAWESLRPDDAEKPTVKSKVRPTESNIGRLRLARTGSVLSYYAAESPDGDFALIQQYAFGTADLKEVRLVAGTGGPRSTLDVRVTDLRVRGESLTRAPDAGPEPPGRPWLWAAAAGSLALVVAGAWLLARCGPASESVEPTGANA